MSKEQSKQVLEAIVLEDKEGQENIKIKRIGWEITSAVSLASACIIVYTGYSFLDDYIQTRPLANFKKTETIEARRDDTYKIFAQMVLKKYSCIREAGAERMTGYLQHNINGNRPLRTEKGHSKIILPIYDCPK